MKLLTNTFLLAAFFIRPGTVFIYTLHISFDLLHIEGIPLMQFHNDLIRHFRLRRDTGQYAVE